MKCKMQQFLLCLFLMLSVLVNNATAMDEEKAHTELRSLLNEVVTLINSGSIDEIDRYLDKNNFVMITGDGQIFSNPNDLKQYWLKLTAPGSRIKKITINPKPAAYTNFLAENIGVAVGTSIDEYDFGNNRKKHMKMFWTVVVNKIEDKWKISKIHYSASISDNLVLDFHKRSIIGKWFW